MAFIIDNPALGPNQHYSPELFKPIFKPMERAPPHAVPHSAEHVKLALSAYVCDPDIALLALLEGDDEAPSSINRKKLIEDPGGLEQLARQLAHVDLAIDAYEPAKVLVETTNSEPPKTLIQQLMQMNAPQLCRTSRERCEDLHELSEDQWGAMIADGRVRINGTECKEPDRLLDRPGELIEFLGSTTGDLLDAIAAQVVEPAKRIAQAAERRSSHAAYHEGDEAIRSESADLARRIADCEPRRLSQPPALLLHAHPLSVLPNRMATLTCHLTCSSDRAESISIAPQGSRRMRRRQ